MVFSSLLLHQAVRTCLALLAEFQSTIKGGLRVFQVGSARFVVSIALTSSVLVSTPSASSGFGVDLRWVPGGLRVGFWRVPGLLKANWVAALEVL